MFDRHMRMLSRPCRNAVHGNRFIWVSYTMTEIGKASMETSTQAFQRPEDMARTLEESAIIERVARIVSSVRGTNPDYTRLATELEQAIPFDVFGVVLLHHDQKALRITVCSHAARVAADSPGAWRANHHQHPLQDSMVEQV